MDRPLFDRVTLIGLGLIGGSLGMAMKKRRLARCVTGVARRPESIRQARKLRAIDEGSIRLREGIEGADLVVIATSPLSVLPIARQVVGGTRHSFILTDVASTKGEITQRMDKILPSRIRFVGSHPMAGSERSGVQAAHPELFAGAPCILTRSGRTDPGALAELSRLWRGVGGRPVVLSPSRHDALVAQISHVPHLAAAALVLSAQPDALKLAAGGFTDATRIALSDPAMWSEICRTNRRELKKALDRFITQMERIKRLLSKRDSAGLLRSLESAGRKRRQLKR